MRSHTFRISPIQRAFTLIELMVVMAIIVILVAVSIPLFSTLTKNNDAVQATNMLSTLIANARSIAISQGRVAGLALYEDTSAGGAGTSQTSAAFVVEDRSLSTPANLYFIPYSDTVQALPRGAKVAALDTRGTNGPANNASTTGLLSASSQVRLILFDASGQLLVRGSLMLPHRSDSTWNSYDKTTQQVLDNWGQTATSDWGWQPTTSAAANNTSTPGLIVYSAEEFKAANLAPTDYTGINSWILNHASVLVVNAYTGTVIR